MHYSMPDQRRWAILQFFLERAIDLLESRLHIADMLRRKDNVLHHRSIGHDNLEAGCDANPIQLPARQQTRLFFTLVTGE